MALTETGPDTALNDSDPVVSDKCQSICQKKKLQSGIYMICLYDWGVLFLGVSNHQVKFVAKLIFEEDRHVSSFPFFPDLVQNQILKPF